MLSTRWQPLVEWNRLENGLDRRVGENGGAGQNQFGIPLNIWQTDDNLMVEAELPGFTMDDLEIYVTGGNQLTIKGERQAPQMQDGSWLRRERAFGAINRMVKLPYPVNEEKVAAEFVNGVLRITLPQAEEAKPRKIKVKAK